VIYALKPIALFTFVPDTYLFGNTYVNVLGINWNEFHANSILGSLGVVLVLWGILSVWLNRHVALFMRFFGFQLGVLLMYCTVGGGGLIVSLLVTPIIRGTNRLAIFAIFIGIMAFVWSLQQFGVRRKLSHRAVMGIGTAVLLFGLGVDNPVIADPLKFALPKRAAAWQQEVKFFRDVEVLAGTEAAVYQLPALAFPEHDPIYHQTRCALYTTLHCSHGDSFGRDGSIFYYMLARASVPTQLAVLSRLGFTGLMIDRSYRNMGDLEQTFRTSLGYAPAIESSDAKLAYYVLPPPIGVLKSGQEPAEVIATAQFLQAEYALSTNTDVRTPIDLRKPWLPGSVKSMVGIYEQEDYGRWSDASDFKNVVVTMRAPLPQKFTLSITALAWTRNINAPVTVVVGNQRQQVRFRGNMTTNVLTFTTDGNAHTITIIPAYRQRASEGDARFLALLLQQIQITPQ
jgi:phosphoglycerol transferase